MVVCIFLGPEEKLCLQWIIRSIFFSYKSVLLTFEECMSTNVYAYFLDQISGDINPNIRQVFL